ncbi:hypothetical protein SODALDRAFT_326401 [Sodiomyces alkalinus F11]|uniref:Uncharacterized protein n=1 Tax=Sodiomyces alkalinus (strain CBS 110278 / VKM F-3762 / F11) TaxID=1314773 RepID=A0A3N2Q618_SODAK|nr:hypothetical protein SODALDRAFT_326401 [Sodiomyces alkalinus F11]ROT42224.1 hypothetical protein SODALDRAFT_326401 [Sodiomyces alkalinus F11]
MFGWPYAFLVALGLGFGTGLFSGWRAPLSSSPNPSWLHLLRFLREDIMINSSFLAALAA